MIRVFVGTDSDIHGKAEKVVEYSCRVNTSQDIDFQFIRPGWKNSVTGFSSHRYLIPKLCNYEGFAIYLDVDMLVLGDLSELWEYKKKGRWCVTNFNPNKYRDDVSVIDCSAFKDLPSEEVLKTKHGKNTARKIIGRRYLMNIPKTWNTTMLSPCTKKCCALRGETPEVIPPETKLIHYTNLKSQPWHPDPNVKYVPYGCKRTADLFFEYLERANAEL